MNKIIKTYDPVPCWDKRLTGILYSGRELPAGPGLCAGETGSSCGTNADTIGMHWDPFFTGYTTIRRFKCLSDYYVALLNFRLIFPFYPNPAAAGSRKNQFLTNSQEFASGSSRNGVNELIVKSKLNITRCLFSLLPNLKMKSPMV